VGAVAGPMHEGGAGAAGLSRGGGGHAHGGHRNVQSYHDPPRPAVRQIMTH